MRNVLIGLMLIIMVGMLFAEADFTVSDTLIVEGNTIQFTDVSTGSPISFQWDFENDGTVDSELQNPTWIYDEPGIYTVSLTVLEGQNSDTETKVDYIDVRVNIPDANFLEVINNKLGEPVGYNPSIVDLCGIQDNLHAENCDIYSIEGVQYLTNLSRLFLGNNQIEDITSVSGLTNLISLSLGNNQIEDITSVSGLINLTNLSLGDNQIVDISYISNLTTLTHLEFKSNHIIDISAISDLINLGVLDLRYNQIVDISAISGLLNLVFLALEDNQIEDISAVSDLTNLVMLSLDNNQIIDISAVSDLTNLVMLSLDNNQIIDISSISNLTNLIDLDLESNNINDISTLSNLTHIHTLCLEHNQFSDIYPFIEILTTLSNSYIQFSDNPLSREAILVHAPQLSVVATTFYDHYPNNEVACYPIPGRNEMAVPTTISLEWQGNFPNRNATYDVWLGESSDNLTFAGDNISTNGTFYSFDPELFEDTDYWWKVRAITETDTLWSGLYHFSTILTVAEDDSITPEIISQIRNYPNPFNPSTTISFVLPKNGKVELDIYNIKGQKVKMLINHSLEAGSHKIVWNGKDNENINVSSGVYFCKISTDNEISISKMLLIK